MTALAGAIDEATGAVLRGWVRDPAFPNAPVVLVVTADDKLLDRVVANRHRPDVEQAGFGSGRFGFDVTFNPPLLPSRSWLIRICSEADGQEVPGSPVRVPAASEFDTSARIAFAAALGQVATNAELDDRIDFLSAQRERLLRLRTASAPPGAEPPRRALVIDHETPDPGRDGGSAALLSHMRSLRRIGYEVTFTAPPMNAGPAADALRAEGFTVCHAPWFNSVEEVLRRGEHGYGLVYLHRVATAAAYASLVRRYQPRARLIYSVADLHHLRLARQAEVQRRPELMAEARRTRAQELWAAQNADAVITHSSNEAALLRQAVPGVRVHVMAWSVPCQPPGMSFSRRTGLAFIGNFRHAPNHDAAALLRDEIMPAVQAQDPEIVCKLVGSDLPVSMSSPRPGLEVAGRVPDLRSVFDSVRLTIAPLRFGAGLKAKVLDSLAAGVPCVCTPVAAEGLDLPAPLRELVASDTPSIVAAILRLHRDRTFNDSIGRLGLRFARSTFSEASLDAAMRDVTGWPGKTETDLGLHAV